MKVWASLGIVVLLIAVASAQTPAPVGPWQFGGQLSVLVGDASAPVAGAPFSAVELTQWQDRLPSGAPITRQQEQTIARDSVGRVRLECGSTDTSATDATVVTINDPVAGYVYWLNPTTKIGIRMSIDASGAPPAGGNAGAALPQNDVNAPQVQTTDLGAQTISGVSATGTRTTITFAAGVLGAEPIQVVREQWVSPDLQLAVLTTGADPHGGRTVTQLTNIVRREPDSMLFQVPAGYVIRIWPSVPWSRHGSSSGFGN